jgi:hypothetical protein
VSCGITLGYHFIYVNPVDKAIVKNVNDNELSIKQQEKVDQQLEMAIGILSAYLKDLSNETRNYRTKVDSALGEGIKNSKEATVRIKTLERRHLEVIRALAVLQKKHWDPEKAAEASGFK